MPSVSASTHQEAINRVRRDVANRAALPAPVTVERAVSAVMSTLVERLTAGEAHRLFEALPNALREMFEAQVLQRDGKPTAKLDRPGFIERVAEDLGVTPAHAELVCAAVFTTVRAELSFELVDDVAHQLPVGLRELWLTTPADVPSLAATMSSDEARRRIEIDIEATAPLPPGVTAAAAFSAVMCVLSQRVSAGEARAVFLGLPDTLRTLVDVCMIHRDEPPAAFGRDELLRRVQEHLEADGPTADAITRAVFRATKRVLPDKIVHDITDQLPSELAELWRGA